MVTGKKTKLKTSFILILLSFVYLFVQTIPSAYAIEDDRAENSSQISCYDSKQEKFTANLTISDRQESEVVRFDVKNMLPGDSIYHEYNVSVSCVDDVTVQFHADVKGDSKKLAEVLKVKVILKENDKTIYDGLMCDMPSSLKYKIKTDSSVTKTLQYDIITYLDTRVGNEYMNQDLEVDFKWWVDEVENLDDIQTGDDSTIVLWSVVAIASLCCVVCLVVRRKKGDANE